MNTEHARPSMDGCQEDAACAVVFVCWMDRAPVDSTRGRRGALHLPARWLLSIGRRPRGKRKNIKKLTLRAAGSRLLSTCLSTQIEQTQVPADLENNNWDDSPKENVSPADSTHPHTPACGLPALTLVLKSKPGAWILKKGKTKLHRTPMVHTYMHPYPCKRT